MRTCSVEGCEAKHYGRGYCHTHWRRWHKYGQAEPAQIMQSGHRLDAQTAHLLDLLKTYGISYRQYDYWLRLGYVPGVELEGTGRFRKVTEFSVEQRERFAALAIASKLRNMTLPDLADAIQDGSVKYVEGFRGD